MVATTEVDEAVTASIEIPVEIPERAVPRAPNPSFEIASMAIGIPGAMTSALLTVGLAMFGARGHLLEAYVGIAIVLGTWLIAMGVVWIGVSSVSAKP